MITATLRLFITSALFHRCLIGISIILLGFTSAIAQWNTSGNNIYSTNSGFVGIGEAFPQAKLHVLSSQGLGVTQGDHLLLTRLAAVGSVNHFMENNWLLRDANGSDWLSTRFHNGISIDASFLVPGNNTRTWWERDPFNNIQSWGTGGEAYMTINDGNVGIGTANPGSFKLAVEGKIGAREVQVTLASPWPDYVFQDSYNLPSLAEVAAYIKQHKHLPDVPSASEVDDQGVKLGEMNLLLLKKVEELTLYVIELQRQNDEMNERLQELER